MQDVRIDIRDTLPAGLEIVDIGISGDGTDATGLLKPIATVSTTTNPNDTVKLEDIRLSTSDLDGSGVTTAGLAVVIGFLAWQVMAVLPTTSPAAIRSATAPSSKG